jgi:hypothetical protein
MFRKIPIVLMVVMLSACSILPLKSLAAEATLTPVESTATAACANPDDAIATAVSGTLAVRNTSLTPPVVTATSPVGESMPANPAGTVTVNAARTSVAGTIAVLQVKKGTLVTPTIAVPIPLSTTMPTPLIPSPTLVNLTETPTPTSTPNEAKGPVIVPTLAVYLPFVENNQTYPYKPQNGTPVRIPNFAHPDKGCAFLAVAGQTLDNKGAAMLNLVVNVGGVLNGADMNGLSLSGAALAYGPAGYEIQLANQPTASVQTLWVQLTDLDGQAVSRRIYFDTTADCQQNVVLVNFQK